MIDFLFLKERLASENFENNVGRRDQILVHTYSVEEKLQRGKANTKIILMALSHYVPSNETSEHSLLPAVLD